MCPPKRSEICNSTAYSDQSRRNYLEDQYDILSEQQRSLPRIYLEHDPPRENPTDTKHIVDDPEMLLVQ